MLVRQEVIKTWTDEEIYAGDRFGSSISSALKTCEFFISILTPDYLSSNYCYDKEFREALRLQQQGKLTILGIVVEPCDWKESPFSELQLVPKDAKPIVLWRQPNSAWLDAIERFRNVIRRKKSSTAPTFLPSLGEIEPSTAEDIRSNATFNVKDAFESFAKVVNDARSAFEAGMAFIGSGDYEVRMSLLIISSYLLRETGDYEIAEDIITHSEATLLTDEDYKQAFEQIRQDRGLTQMSLAAWKRLLWIHARLLLIRSEIYSDQDKLAEAETAASLSQAIGQKIGDRNHVAEIGINIADILRKKGKTRQAQALLEDAINEFRANRNYQRQVAFAYCSLSHIQVGKGQYKEAISNLSEAILIAKYNVKDILMEGIFHGDLSNAYHLNGMLFDALSEATTALDIVLPRNHRRCISYFSGTRGDIYKSMCKKEEAQSDYEFSLRIAEESSNYHCIAKACLRLGDFWSSLDEREKAIANYRKGCENWNKHDDRVLLEELNARLAVHSAI